MRQREEELEELGVRVLVVTFQPDAVGLNYIRQTGLQWPLLIDEARELYGAYGMERGRWGELLAPEMWWAYFKLMARGRRPRGPSGGDVKQLGGDVLIDPQGTVRLHHVGRNPADRPPVNSLLQTVREAAEASSP